MKFLMSPNYQWNSPKFAETSGCSNIWDLRSKLNEFHFSTSPNPRVSVFPAVLALRGVCFELNWWLSEMENRIENELKTNKFNGVKQITRAKSERVAMKLIPPHLWCDKSTGIAQMAATTIDSDSDPKSASFAISGIIESRVFPACSPAIVFRCARLTNVMLGLKKHEEENEIIFQSTDDWFSFRWRSFECDNEKSEQNRTYKLASESRSSNKSLGRKSKLFFEMSSVFSMWRPRNVSLWSVDKWFTDKSLQSHMWRGEELENNQTRFNSSRWSIWYVSSLILLVHETQQWTYMWLMSLGIDWVAGTLFKSIRQQLICLSDGKHLKCDRKWFPFRFRFIAAHRMKVEIEISDFSDFR